MVYVEYTEMTDELKDTLEKVKMALKIPSIMDWMDEEISIYDRLP